MIRSVRKTCRSPSCSIGGRRATSASNAVGQSSSVPRRSPIRCSGKARQMMRDLRAPSGPVVRYVPPPDVELVTDAFLREQRREPPRLVESAGRVLPRALTDDEQQARAGAQPLQVV